MFYVLNNRSLLKAFVLCFLFLQNDFVLGQADKIVAQVIEKNIADSLKIKELKVLIDKMPPYEADFHLAIGACYTRQAMYSSAEGHLQKAIAIFSKRNDAIGEIKCRINRGFNYCFMGEPDLALTDLKKARLLSKKIKNKLLEGKSVRGIGLVYGNTQMYDKALIYYNEALELDKTAKDSVEISSCYSLMGNIHLFQRDTVQALKYWKLAAGIGERNKKSPESDYYNISETLYLQSNKEESEKYLQKAEAISLKSNNLNMLAHIYCFKGTVMAKENKDEEAIKFFLEAEKCGLKSGSGTPTIASCEGLCAIYTKKGDYKKAYEIMERLNGIREHFRRSAFSKDLAENQAKYETSVLKEENKRKDAEAKLKDAEIAGEKANKRILLGGIFLVLVIAVLITLSLIRSKKANRLISEQRDKLEIFNQEIVHQKEIVEEKNKEITDSIQYAKRIQSSLLPSIKYINRSLDRLKKSK